MEHSVSSAALLKHANSNNQTFQGPKYNTANYLSVNDA